MQRYVVIGLMLTLAVAAQSQEKKTRWSLSGGPTGFMGPNGWVSQDGDRMFTQDEPVITGANRGRFNVGLGMSRPLSGSLTWRIDALYNLATSAPEPHYTLCDPANPPTSPFFRCGGPRAALRDDLVLGTVGLQWDAFPSSRWSPYLLTSAGVALSRLQWSRDPAASQPDETTMSRGLVLGAGLGVRFPLLRYEGFIETRRHRMSDVYSSKFMPLSFGLRF
jgi:hypothetical protein